MSLNLNRDLPELLALLAEGYESDAECLASVREAHTHGHLPQVRYRCEDAHCLLLEAYNMPRGIVLYQPAGRRLHTHMRGLMGAPKRIRPIELLSATRWEPHAYLLTADPPLAHCKHHWMHVDPEVIRADVAKALQSGRCVERRRRSDGDTR